MCPLVTTTDHRVYQVRGLDSGLRYISKKSWNNEYGGHILEIEDELPQDATNPVGLWLGHSFASRAVELKGPKLPSTQEWKELSDGRYKIEECQCAYSILNDWVEAAGKESLERKDYQLACMMRWALPFSPVTQAVLYFTTENKSIELQWQSRTSGKTVDELVRNHLELKERLVGRN